MLTHCGTDINQRRGQGRPCCSDGCSTQMKESKAGREWLVCTLALTVMLYGSIDASTGGSVALQIHWSVYGAPAGSGDRAAWTLMPPGPWTVTALAPSRFANPQTMARAGAACRTVWLV